MAVAHARSQALKYPFDGQLYPSKGKKFRETVFFVHFFEGRKAALRRHITLVNGLGYDAFAFHLRDDFSLWNPPFAADGRLGYKHVYADQIEELLNEISGGKIIYAFSNPTASAIEAMARRHCSDTVALIADSGPSAQFVKSAENLFSRQKGFNPLAAKMIAPAFSLIWSGSLHRDVHDDLKSFPENFPILSIRGWKDPLIPPDHIDGLFGPHSNLDWRKLALPEAGHLNGLKDFRDDYVPAVSRFLTNFSTPL